MMEKKKLYQIIADGPNQGQIKTLSKISVEEGVTYLEFEDGTRCNVAYVAGLNDPKAYDSGMYAAEVIDTKNIWEFKKIKKGPEEKQAYSEKTGEWYDIADPYYDPKGDKRGVSKIITQAIPPKHVVTKDEAHASAKRLKELGLENVEGFAEGAQNITIPTQQDLMRKQMSAGMTAPSYGNVEKEGTTIALDPNSIMPPTAKDLAKYARGTEVYIPENLNEGVSTPQQQAPVQAQAPQVPTSVPRPDLNPQTINSIVSGAPEIDKTSAVYAIVSKCKKNPVKSSLVLELSLPGKSTYEVIRDNFEDGSIDEFFDIIISEISVDKIKESLRKALKASYEGPGQAEQ